MAEITQQQKSQSKSLNERVATTVKNKVQLGKLKLEKVVDDISSASQGDLKRVSPDGYKLLYDFLSDAVSDELDPNTAPGVSVPIEFFLDLPDQSRLRLRYDPKSKATEMKFGVKF